MDFEADVIMVTGKGRRPRAVPFGRQAGRALDRYLRARARHRDAAGPDLWLGLAGPMTASGLAQVITERGRYSAPRSTKPLDAATVSARVSNPVYRSRFVRRKGLISLAGAE